MPEAKDILAVTPLIAFFLICAYVLMKSGVPAWKEVKLRHLELKTAELAVRKEEAQALGKIGDVFRQITETTDELKIFMRAGMRQSEGIVQQIAGLEASVADNKATLDRVIADSRLGRG